MLESQRTQTQSVKSKKGTTQRSKLGSTQALTSHISNPPETEFTVDMTLFNEFRSTQNFSKHAAFPTSFSNLSNKSSRSRSQLKSRLTQNASAATGKLTSPEKTQKQVIQEMIDGPNKFKRDDICKHVKQTNDNMRIQVPELIEEKSMKIKVFAFNRSASCMNERSKKIDERSRMMISPMMS